jgi:lipoprotein signal peptidase
MTQASVRILFLTAAIFAAVLDLWSKSTAFAMVRSSPDGVYQIWPGKLEFIERYNTAAMWSVGFGYDSSNLILKSLGLAIAVVVFVWGMWFVRAGHRWTACLLGFILGGAVGNVSDRFAYVGVRDFIQVYFWNPFAQNYYAYPTFNVADSFLMCSMAALILGQWRAGKTEAKSAAALAT